jgi:cellulose synthase/poly-beta-1,6-N-acetylglucosamine synthase-like glycosyltransferase
MTAHALRLGLAWVLVGLVFVGALPLFTGLYQYLLVALHSFRLHYRKCAPYLPRTAILIPAWNEGAVLATSIDRLMRLDYPPESLRVYVVDDASTDDTPDVVRAKAEQYPGRVLHLRREKGGEGKAHTLNHGLRIIMAEDWMQALLIMDADVVYERPALRAMARHLADPSVGAVTAYIQEGSRPGNYLTRFIAYEYITAQAAARRAQNVLGALACLAGGAQLHSRENLAGIGGQIDTATLAEDTVTTFRTQLAGRKVLFEPHAIVWAEEPGSIAALWKQRLRWARGNVQVTWRFRKVWFRPGRAHRLGGIGFGAIWFSVFLLPATLLLASASLIGLYFVDNGLSHTAFRALWILNLITYVFVVAYSLVIDPRTGRRSWRQGIMFPGAISLLIMASVLLPAQTTWLERHGLALVGVRYGPAEVAAWVLFTYAWLAGSMAIAYLARLAERDTGSRRILAAVLLYLGGYGSLLCAITLAAYVKEFRHAEMTWEKTDKTGKMAALD